MYVELMHSINQLTVTRTALVSDGQSHYRIDVVRTKQLSFGFHHY